MVQPQQHRIEEWDVIDWSGGELYSKLGSHKTVKSYIEGNNNVRINAYECEDFRVSIKKFLDKKERWNAEQWFNTMVMSGNWRVLLVNLENQLFIEELYKGYMIGTEPPIEIFDIETYKEVMKLKML